MANEIKYGGWYNLVTFGRGLEEKKIIQKKKKEKTFSSFLSSFIKNFME